MLDQIFSKSLFAFLSSHRVLAVRLDLQSEGSRSEISRHIGDKILYIKPFNYS